MPAVAGLDDAVVGRVEQLAYGHVLADTGAAIGTDLEYRDPFLPGANSSPLSCATGTGWGFVATLLPRLVAEMPWLSP